MWKPFLPKSLSNKNVKVTLSKDIDSKILLAKTLDIITSKGYKIGKKTNLKKKKYK